MNILIAGDFFISDKFRNKDLIDQSVVDSFQKADYRIVNLEAPITPDNPENKILKTGKHLRMSEETVIPFLKQLNVNAVTLANNHILDYGAKGLSDTFDVLKNNHVDFVGAGNNLAEANKHISLDHEGMRIAILNFCENEWSIAEDDAPGANPMDVIDNTNQIKTAKITHDKVICIIHGGHEYYHLPSPRMVKQYRFYVDNGADAILGHHTHCIGGYEVYKDVPIIYSLGNFVFTLKSKKEIVYTGLTAKLIIENDKNVTFELTPVVQRKNNFKTETPRPPEDQEIKNKIKGLNRLIKNQKDLEKQWSWFQKEKEQIYLNIFSPIHFFDNRYVSYFIKRLHIYGWFMNKKHYRLILNILRCESHHDISKKIFRSFLGIRKTK